MSAPLSKDLNIHNHPASLPDRERLSQAASTLASLFGASEPMTLEEAGRVIGILSFLGDDGVGHYSGKEEAFLEDWRASRLEFQGRAPRICLEESVYKVWTTDRAHPMSGKTGYSFGDPAQHMAELFSLYGLETSPELMLAPDHLSYLLEFLSLFLETRPEQEIESFCRDHLDWIPDLREKIHGAGGPEVLERLVISTQGLIDQSLRLTS
jgi:hypothetical protein